MPCVPDLERRSAEGRGDQAPEAEDLRVGALSASVVETQAPFEITVVRWKVRSDGNKEGSDGVERAFRQTPRKPGCLESS